MAVVVGGGPAVCQPMTRPDERTQRPEQDPWLFGAAADLLFGAGLLYTLVFLVQALAGDAMRAWLPLAAYPIVTLVLGAPHYGATLLRVYADRTDRARYALVAVHATALLAVLYVAGLHWPLLGSVLITLYFTISPWHYSGQNFGVALLFLRRRDLSVSIRTRRALQASFVISYLLVFVTLHASTVGLQQAPGSVGETIYEFIGLGIPRVVALPLALALMIGYVVALGVATAGLRGVPLPGLLPTGCVVLLQALWFGVPSALAILGWTVGVDPLDAASRGYTLMWIASGHFIQYLWITSYSSSGRAGIRGIASFYQRSLLAGAALWFLPLLVFAPGYLGPVPFAMGLSILTAAVVNLHHFALDSVVWKLRDGRVAQMLLRSAPLARDAKPQPRPARRGLRYAGTALCALALVFAVASLLVARGYNEAVRSGDEARLGRAVSLMAWFGRASPRGEVALARLAWVRGDVAEVMTALDRADAIFPSGLSLRMRAAIHAREERWEEALDAYDAALRLEPSQRDALLGSARALEALGRPEKAAERRAEVLRGAQGAR